MVVLGTNIVNFTLSMKLPNFDELCAQLRSVADEEVLSRFQQSSHRLKADGSPVTEADVAVQRRLQEVLRERYPGFLFLGEEMSAADQERLLSISAPGVWCLDPLDGTSNFTGGLPFFSVSLGLIRDGMVEQGMVYDPYRKECFSAERGNGAWLNGKPLHLNHSQHQLDECLAVVDFKRLPAKLIERLSVKPPYRSQRNLGSVALEWCWLAARRFQLYLHGGQKLWDHAAGRLILQEAGGAACLLISGQSNCSETIDLAPRIALAAVDNELLTTWKAWLAL